jgi:hypothetical protein
MTARYLVAVLACVAFSAADATAIDLAKIDRSIKKEPVYQSKSPKYCLLVIGPEAKTRIWLVLDGDVLYIDRNGNGDLTEKGERVEKQQKGKLSQFQVGDVLDADGKTKHSSIMVMREEEMGQTIISVAGMVGGRHMFMAGLDSHGLLEFADRPQDAPILHFGGPLQMGLNAKFSASGKLELIRSDKGEELYAWVGTPGLGKGTFAAIMHQVSGIPGDVHPVAEIEFPNKKANGPPLKAKVILKERC